MRRFLKSCGAIFALLAALAGTGRAAENAMLTDVPDYSWYAGCYGPASGNLMGYWDRHGFPGFYTGPTAGGVAPLDSAGGNSGIRSLWASKAGVDGRPADKLGHINDYWFYYEDDAEHSFESTVPDPYVQFNFPEHEPDCIGDFIGMSQRKWTNLNGECDGNIDGYAFIFWDASGERRVNFTPPEQDGKPVPDVPSGYRAWTRYRQREATVFSQLADFNATVSSGKGFTFDDLKAEIDAGYPVVLHLQNPAELFFPRFEMPRGNPYIHAMLAFGYYVTDSGAQYVRYKTSWGSSGNNTLSEWNADAWQAELPVRGVIGYRPLPQITKITPANNSLHLEWDGPSSVLSNLVTQASTPLHWYVVEKSSSLAPETFVPVTEPSTERSATISDCCGETAFFRLKLTSVP